MENLNIINSQENVGSFRVEQDDIFWDRSDPIKVHVKKTILEAFLLT